jgi:hypothetical protein
VKFRASSTTSVCHGSINLSYSKFSSDRARMPHSGHLLTGHPANEQYVHDLRLRLGQQFAGVVSHFFRGHLSQILNFGLPSPN